MAFSVSCAALASPRSGERCCDGVYEPYVRSKMRAAVAAGAGLGTHSLSGKLCARSASSASNRSRVLRKTVTCENTQISKCEIGVAWSTWRGKPETSTGRRAESSHINRAAGRLAGPVSLTHCLDGPCLTNFKATWQSCRGMRPRPGLTPISHHARAHGCMLHGGTEIPGPRID